MDKIAVLIPCFNEEKTIEKVVKDSLAALPDAVVYVYDNNSTDATAEVARKAGAVVRREPRQGKGYVLRRMFKEINALCYICVDGDDTYPMEAAPEMARLVLEGGADMVVGDRLSSTYFTKNKRPFHNFGNSLVRKTINSLFDSDIKDIMTGFRALSYEFVKSYPVLSRGFEIETEMTIHAVFNEMIIENVPVEYRNRPEGSVSKLNTLPDGFKVIATIIRLYKNYKPFRFFSTLAALMLVVAAVMFLWVFSRFLETHLVENMPTLIVSGFIALAALQSFFSGMILSDMVTAARRDFEKELYRLHDRKQEAKDH
ncbi:MAG: glycosyltransferase family 2 protein [Lachnospiraceae bacterium]|nr:glycosyltransferase [Lachnospiraceae bacterium]MCR4937110.1 glycosyltransferase family 2 protein [Lachnospiraceae bacterium]